MSDSLRPPCLDLDAIEERVHFLAPYVPFTAVSVQEVLALVAEVRRLSTALVDVGIKHDAEIRELRAQVMSLLRLSTQLLKDSLPPEEKP